MKKKHLGDRGRTRLLGGAEVSKNSWRPRVYGAVDEASSAIGLARALMTDSRLQDMAREAQADLYTLGAELASTPAEAERFGFAVPEAAVERLDAQMSSLIAERPLPKAFVIPGGSSAGAALDLARTIVRRAEREYAGAIDEGQLEGGAGLRFLNRLSDLLFVMARFLEGAPELSRDLRPGAAETRRQRRSQG
jgi:cob(I)alamin adenosyltransferase